MPRHNIEGLEKKITALSKALANLNSEKDLRELILLIKRPGWTTPAEFILVSGLVDSLAVQVKAIEQTKNALLKGSQRVAIEQ